MEITHVESHLFAMEEKPSPSPDVSRSGPTESGILFTSRLPDISISLH